MNKHGLKVGQKIVLVTYSRYTNCGKVNEEYEISKVGRKYFQIRKSDGSRSHLNDELFHLDTLKRKTIYTAETFIYLSMDEYNKECEFNRIQKEARGLYVGHLRHGDITIEDLKTVIDIFNKCRNDKNKIKY